MKQQQQQVGGGAMPMLMVGGAGLHTMKRTICARRTVEHAGGATDGGPGDARDDEDGRDRESVAALVAALRFQRSQLAAIFGCSNCGKLDESSENARVFSDLAHSYCSACPHGMSLQ